MKLIDIIDDFLNLAEQKNPNAIRRSLGHGLQMNVRCDGGVYVFLIWRNNVVPSQSEWATIIKHWPYKVDAPYPESGVYKERFYLRARIPRNPNYV